MLYVNISVAFHTHIALVRCGLKQYHYSPEECLYVNFGFSIRNQRQVMVLIRYENWFPYYSDKHSAPNYHPVSLF